MRELTPFESDLIRWVLPEDRPGYRKVLDMVRGWNVVEQGRRGEGHLILAPADTVVDQDSPLSQVLAFGEVFYEHGECLVTVREPLGRQVDVEIAGASRGAERRRWTLSTWSPGEPCPQCGGALREVRADTAGGNAIHLCICPADKRLWVHEARSGVSHPVPMTLYYSELMRQTGTRDPAIALDASRLFGHLGSYSDADMLRAFASYNELRAKVASDDRIIVPERSKGLFARILSFFRRTS